MSDFIARIALSRDWALSRAVVTRFRISLQERGLSASSINQRLAAVRQLAYEAADCGLASQLVPP